MRASTILVAVAALAGAAIAQTPSTAVDRGRTLFDKPFHLRQGVGAPEMNADSCRACHQDPVLGGAGALELNVTRFGRIIGSSGEFVELPGGQGLSKLFPPMTPGREEHPVGQANVFEQRQTPSILGDGLISTILDPTILANEDPTDANGDGIFGIARRVDVGAGGIVVGKYGWKAQIPTLRDFVHDAMMGELGITTPDEGRGFGSRTDADNVQDPELTFQQIQDLTEFLHSLPAPERKGSTDPRVAAGERVFDTVGCAACHIPTLQGAAGPVPLYSNLLLHNVMPAGFRGMAEPGAPMGFYRTPPLWGIGDTAPYMHDGRAEDLHGAIMAHDGEAAAVRLRYEGLTLFDREALILFLEDL